MADDSAERPKSAMIRRHEQLQRWKTSDLAKTSDSRKNKKTKVKFQAGCVFLAACASGDIDDVQHLLDIGADINYANIDGLTALHQAVIDENQDMVEFLLEHGANIEAQDNEGWTPLHAAASCGFIDIASFLLENGANIAAVNNEGEIPLDLAEEEDMEEFLEEEIDKAGIDAEEARSEEENIMLRDAKQWLNNKNIKEKAHPTTGASALHVAASKGYTKVIELLLQNKADVNIKDFDGWTPLHAASHWGSKEAVELLVENMADMEAKNKLGQTAFDLADDEDMLPYLTEMKKKQASMKKDTKPTTPRIDGKIPPPFKRSIMKRSGESHRLSLTGSSVTRISVPDKNLLIHQDMEKERKELAMKIHGKHHHQDKKTMESSSSSEESETETSSSEEEEEEVKKPAPKAAPTPVTQNRKPPTLPPVSKPPPTPTGGKKELPSFSPKPLTPVKQDSKEPEVPAWRTGLRKTGSTILPEPKKPEERVQRSASAPKIADQKPAAVNNRWQNERLSSKPEEKKAVTVAKLPPPRARIQEDKTDVEKPKSFMAPSKEEEAETVRRARAKRERSSRRSTQGVTAEDIESAVSSIKKAQVDNKLADKNKTDDSSERKATTTKPLRAETEPEVSTVSLRKPEEKKVDAPAATFTARPRLSATISNDSGSTSTVKLTPRYSSKTDDIKEKEREKEKEKDNDDKSPRKSAALLRRKPREKRRDTGIIHREGQEEEEESESGSGLEESEEKPAPKSTDRYSRTGGAGSRVGDSSTTATVDRYGSRGSADRNSTYSTRDKDKAASTPCASCKKIVDDKDALISKLEREVKTKDAEIADLKSKSGTSRFSSGTSSDNDRREKRALERRISELEEEVKTVKQLKADNQRLKDENGALVRVISKLSK